MANKIELGFFKIRMSLKLNIITHPFIISEYPDAIFEVLDLKQTGTVQNYYEELEGFCNLMQLTEEDALQIFINNLNPEIFKSVRSFYPKTMEDALKLAKCYERPKNHDSPYEDSNITPTIQTAILPPPNQFLLPSFLPKPMNPSIFPLSSPSTFSKPIIDLCSTNKRDSEYNFITSFSKDDNKPKKKCGVAVYKFESAYVTYHRNLGRLSIFRIIVGCEKFVVTNDPYGFRLLLMGRRNHGIDMGKSVFIMELINETAKVPSSSLVFADVGVAICDFENNLILDMRKRLEEAKHMNDEMIEIETVVQGLNATLSLDLERATVFVDDKFLQLGVSFADTYIQVLQSKGFVSAEILASNLDKAWLSFHIWKTMSAVISVPHASKKYESSSCLQDVITVARNLIKNPKLVSVIGATKLIVRAILEQKGLFVEDTEKWWSYEVVATNCSDAKGRSYHNKREVCTSILVFILEDKDDLKELVLDQNLYYLGMKYTIATYPSAFVNMLPAVTFILVMIFKLERITVKKICNLAEIIGIAITIVGAMVMTLYKDPTIDFIKLGVATPHGTTIESADKHWVTGTIMLLGSIFGWSSFFILQSFTLKKYLAELSLTAWTCFMGMVQGVGVSFVMIRDLSAWKVGLNSRLLTTTYSGIMCSEIAYYVQGVVIKERRPVFVTSFSTLFMIITASLGAIVLAKKIHLGSIIGAIIIVSGFYIVVWEESKDGKNSETDEKSNALQEFPITDMTKLNDGGIKKELATATASGKFKDEIIPVATKIVDTKNGDKKLVTISIEDGIRPNTSLSNLAKLKVVFKKNGRTTARNSSQVSDGVGAVLLMKRSVTMHKRLLILGVFRTFTAVGLDPAIMSVGPTVTIPAAVKTAGLELDDVWGVTKSNFQIVILEDKDAFKGGVLMQAVLMLLVEGDG